MKLNPAWLSSPVRRMVLTLGLLLSVIGKPLCAEPVLINTSLDFQLQAQWFAVSNAKKPTVLALHGCGGLYTADGKTLQTRYREYVQRLNAAGYQVLLPDSFTSRGSGPICSIKNQARTIEVEDRRQDVLAALQWLHKQPNVDSSRIGLLGWSHGAMTVLSAINTKRSTYAHPLAGAAVFYPGCREPLKNLMGVDTPLLMQLGAKDDWTAPGPCIELAKRLKSETGADVTVQMYADSYHGFDGPGPVRFRSDVPNGVASTGVHVGGNPVARAQALAALDTFFRRIFE